MRKIQTRKKSLLLPSAHIKSKKGIVWENPEDDMLQMISARHLKQKNRK